MYHCTFVPMYQIDLCQESNRINFILLFFCSHISSQLVMSRLIFWCFGVLFFSLTAFHISNLNHFLS